MTPSQPERNSSAYLALGGLFIILGLSMKGMLAFVGVGAAFLFLYFRKQRKDSD